MKKHFLLVASAVILIVFQSACAMMEKSARTEVVATYTGAPVKVDGNLDEPAWQKTPVYCMAHPKKSWEKSPPEVQKFFRNGVRDTGKIRLLWDEKYLYVGIEFFDKDIVAEASQDQIHHYLMGDVAEVFLKPMNQSWYWEMYVSPAGYKTAFFFTGRGSLGLPSGFPKKVPFRNMKTAAKVIGTLNNSWDQDQKWTAEMAIPIAEVNMVGEKLQPDVPWLIFFGRYNYSRYQPVLELMSFPCQALFPNYHRHEEYGILKMLKPSTGGK